VGKALHRLQALAFNANEGAGQGERICRRDQAFDVIEVGTLDAYQLGEAIPSRRAGKGRLDRG
jgi:hypothetical protein